MIEGGGVPAAGAKEDGVIVDADEARISDGDAVGVEAEVALLTSGARRARTSRARLTRAARPSISTQLFARMAELVDALA
jgi:hypothetical protein